MLILLVNNRIVGQNHDNSYRQYYCYKTSGLIKIDGVADESAWNLAPWSENFVDIEGTSKPKFSTQYKMLWDDSCLYVFAKLEEPHIWATLTEKDAIIYRDNDFEIFIDPEGDAKNYFETEVNAFGTVLDLFMDKPYNKRGKADFSWDCTNLRTGIRIDGTINNPDDNDRKWSIEMAIPWRELSHNNTITKPPKSGETWRMNFSRVQWSTKILDGKYEKIKNKNTGKPLPENNWVWSSQGVVNMHIPEKWGYVTFKEPMPIFWTWLGGTKERSLPGWDSVFMEMKEIGIHGALINGDTTLLNKIIPVARHHDIQIHAWFWTMNRGDADTAWLSVNRLGKSLAEEKAYVGYYKFMCPALPEVKEFLLDKMAILSSIDGLHGIHMDYIRYVDAILPVGLQPKYGIVQDHIFPEFDYGYHPYLLNLFEEKTGTNPLSLEDPEKNEQWLQFRLDELKKTVDTLTAFIKKQNLIISAAVFPTPEISRTMVRQEWNKWNLDCYFPMVYHNFYNESFDWIKEVMKTNEASFPDSVNIYCGLYLPALKEKNDLTKAMKAAFDGGANGLSFFSFGSLTENQKSQI
ncbi:MAG: hypothetical protein K8R53_03355, partial [Bacteroidales bacterium]|nr:hypothetical protein [Bacteroidales bacterium]